MGNLTQVIDGAPGFGGMGNVTGSGIAPQIALWNGLGQLIGSNTFLYDPITQRFLLNGNRRLTGSVDSAVSHNLLASEDGVTFTDLTVNRAANLLSIASLGDGTIYEIKLAYNSAGAGQVTINPNGADTIEGQPFWTLTTKGEAVTIRAKGDVNDWRIMG